MSNRAWVTLATNDSYGLGALVLAHSLRRAGSVYPAVVLITPSVTEAMRERLGAVFAEVVTVDVLDSGDAAHLALLQRPELGITFTKIHCWNLTQYEKCVFLDADTLIVQNCDELFEREELSAAPDVGWPDCFNSGVFVFKPSAETFSSLITFAQERGSFDGGDQGLLNSYFSDWAHGDINKHLPFLYNVTSAAFYSYLPALKHYGQNLKIIHFIGAAKPWLQQFNWESRSVEAPEHLREFLQLWWDLFASQVHSQLDISMVEVEEAPAPIPPPSQETFNFEAKLYDRAQYEPILDSGSEFHWHHSDNQIPESHFETRLEDQPRYEPLRDSESEFHWHHPDTHIPESHVEMTPLDYTQFHDPWEVYRGHIPPITNEVKNNHISMATLENHEDIRKHAWEYTSSQYQNTNRINYEPESQNTWQHDTTSHYINYIQHDDYQSNNEKLNEIDHIAYSHQTEPRSEHRYGYQEKCFDHTVSASEKYKKDYYEHMDMKHDSIDNTNKYNSQPSIQQDESAIHEYYTQTINYPAIIQQDKTGTQEFHTPAADYHEYPARSVSIRSQQKKHNQNKSSHIEYNPQSNELMNKNHKDYNNDNNYVHDQKLNAYFESHNQTTYVTNQVEPQIQTIHLREQLDIPSYTMKNKPTYVYCVHLDHERKRGLKHKKTKSIEAIDVLQKSNGYPSDAEMEDYTDAVIPRHPYDGFYLRHKMTIDSYGRKICTHEIPPTPSPTLSPPNSPIFYDAVSELPASENTNLEIGFHDQSGVAGNLARVSPDVAGQQREAIDELTRRQGWEAGNIDYMGADSFANIWAKISQTLSQPPASPPKEPTPPKEQIQTESSPTECAPSESSAVEIAKPTNEALKEIPSAEIIPVEPPTSTGTSVTEVSSASAAITAPVDISTATEASATTPPEITKAANISSPVEPIASEAVDPAKPANSVIPEETIVKVVASNETTTPTKPSSAPLEVPTPVEPAIASDSNLPTEIPIPVIEAVLAETAISTAPDAKKPTEQEELKTASNIVVTAAIAEQVKSDKIPQEETNEPKISVTETAKDEKTKDIVSESAAIKAPKTDISVTPTSPVVATEDPVSPTAEELPKADAAPTKTDAIADIPSTAATDSPPLATTPSKEEILDDPAGKSEERRKPVGKLQLSPPAKVDPLPTPDSELEDAASLAQSIIASELRTPTVTSPSPPAPASPSQPQQDKRLSVEEPQVPTPPIGSVSLSQIGVKPKEKSTIAAQIESSISDEAPASSPKKKVVKKVLKKDGATSGEAPVPPPRKKEKKPKEK